MKPTTVNPSEDGDGQEGEPHHEGAGAARPPARHTSPATPEESDPVVRAGLGQHEKAVRESVAWFGKGVVLGAGQHLGRHLGPLVEHLGREIAEFIQSLIEQ